MERLLVDALRQALQSDSEIRLVSSGKKSENRGLFATRSGANKQAIEACLNASSPLLEIERTEKKGKTQHHFVSITEEGIRWLANHVSVPDLADLLAEAPPDRRQLLFRELMRVTEQEFLRLRQEREAIMERQRTAAESVMQFAKAFVASLDNEIAQLSDAMERVNHWREQSVAVVSESKSIELITSSEEPIRPASPRPKPERSLPEPETETDVDFQRDLATQLVFAWQEARSEEARELLEAALFNVSVERIGEPGERVRFDGLWHETGDSVQGEEEVEVVQSGWQLINRRGKKILQRAKVRSPRKEGAHHV